MTPVLSQPNAQSLADLTNIFASTGTVDATSNLAGSKVYIYSGVLDTVVSRSVVTAAQQYYQIFNANVTTGVCACLAPCRTSCRLVGGRPPCAWLWLQSTPCSASTRSPR